MDEPARVWYRGRLGIGFEEKDAGMHRNRIRMFSAAAVMIFAVPGVAVATTVIGGTGQSSQQGAGSSQSGSNGSGGGATYILGDSAPTTNQNSTNLLVNVQDIGDATLIAPGSSCFCQSSQQAVNSSQVAANGDGGGSLTAILGDSSPTLNQNSQNIGVNVELIGGGGDTTIIGGTAQVNAQAFNSVQSGENAPGATGVLFVGGDSNGTLNQNSTNALINVALIGGDGGGGLGGGGLGGGGLGGGGLGGGGLGGGGLGGGGLGGGGLGGGGLGGGGAGGGDPCTINPTGPGCPGGLA